MENISNTVVKSTDTKPESTGESAIVKGLLDPEIKDEFSGVLTTLSAFRQQITMLQNQVRGLEKHVNKKMKTLQREAKKNKNKGNRKPSGFAVPTKITDQLCEFMNKEKGTMVARTEVTQYIIEYIRENQLQKDGNRKFITPDIKLATLLDVKDDDEVTYFNIQRYMNKHFVKEKA
jgi:chromatin remodeling complex protein RSC6